MKRDMIAEIDQALADHSEFTLEKRVERTLSSAAPAIKGWVARPEYAERCAIEWVASGYHSEEEETHEYLGCSEGADCPCEWEFDQYGRQFEPPITTQPVSRNWPSHNSDIIEYWTWAACGMYVWRGEDAPFYSPDLTENRCGRSDCACNDVPPKKSLPAQPEELETW